MSVGSDTRPDTSKYGLWCSRNYLHKVRFLPHYEEIIGVLVNDLTMACNYSKQEQIDLIYTYGAANKRSYMSTVIQLKTKTYHQCIESRFQLNF